MEGAGRKSTLNVCAMLRNDNCETLTVKKNKIKYILKNRRTKKNTRYVKLYRCYIESF